MIRVSVVGKGVVVRAVAWGRRGTGPRDYCCCRLWGCQRIVGGVGVGWGHGRGGGSDGRRGKDGTGGEAGKGMGRRVCVLGWGGAANTLANGMARLGGKGTKKRGGGGAGEKGITAAKNDRTSSPVEAPGRGNALVLSYFHGSICCV